MNTWLKTINRMYKPNSLGFLQYSNELKSISNQTNVKTCAFSQNLSKTDNSANKPKFVCITINNRLPRCYFTIKGVRRCSNRPDVHRLQIHGDKSPPCPPSSNPALH